MDKNEELNNVIEALSLATSQRAHPFHLLTFAYQGDSVEVCTVVLRKATNEAISFHTNVHSKKVVSCRVNSRVSLLGYDKENKWQIRLKGEVVCHHQNDVSFAAWQQMKSFSKLCYSNQPPGLEMDDVVHDESLVKTQREALEKDPMIGYEHFVVCEIRLDHIESLRLHYLGHQRLLCLREGDQSRSVWISS